ncbi:MAG: ATP-binding protein [Bacteroidota bacterium]
MIVTFWNWVSEFGASDRHPDENEIIRLYNQMSIVSTFGTLMIMVISWCINYPFVYTFLTALVATLYIGVIVLNYFGKITLARYFVSLGSPLWVSTVNMLIGGYFCQGLVVIASIAITYVAFRSDLRKILLIIGFHILVFFTSVIYNNIYGPVFGTIDLPYDEITVFIGGLGWSFILMYKFDRDQRNLVENLKVNNEELKTTTEELERFTYIASHDLKSPLRTIISFIDLIERNIQKEKYSEVKENLNFVRTGAKQMNFLVQDILEFSKLRNHEKNDYAWIDLNVVLEKVKHNLNEDIRQKNAIIHANHLPHFWGNELEFLLLFQNFIQNGIKYNERKQPMIRVSASAEDQQMKLSFKDNGIGIEEQYHEQIFQFFKRLHNSVQYQGTGLGLGLCKKIINNYNGSVAIDSQLSVGTTFTLLFPIEKPAEKDVGCLGKIKV